MKNSRRFFNTVVSLGLVLILAGAVQVPQPAWASMEDAAVFYEELTQYGDWVEYENYGPVWYPNQVQENWRPYVDGRWNPSEQGHVFETQEPWGWATYHYGNWMPTDSYGWVWVPGRTWYPSTVTWRQSPESDAPDSSYLGWAPIPPDNYVPPQGYYPPGYSGEGPYRGPVESLVTAPFRIFVRAASFLLGLGQPYAPNYSYWNSAALVPPTYTPYYYGRTVVINNYYTPSYYPTNYIGAGRGYYNYGPPIPYVARVSRVNPVVINNYIKQVNIYKFRNVAPPQQLLARRGYFRDMMPPAMVQRQPLGQVVRAQNMRMARANLARPNVVNANVIKNAPTFQKLNVKIPKAQMTQMTPGRGFHGARNVPGAALPASAMMQPTQQMEKSLRKIPPNRQINPVAPTARKWNVPQTPGAAAIQPTAVQKPGAAGTPQTFIPGQRPGKGPQALQPGGTQALTPGKPGTFGATPGQRQKQQLPTGMKPGAPGTPQAGMQPGSFKPGKKGPGAQGLTPAGTQAVTPGKPGTFGATPGQRQKQQLPTGMKPGAPGTPQAGMQPGSFKPGKKGPGAQGLTPASTQGTTPGQTPFQRRQQATTPGAKPGETQFQKRQRQSTLPSSGQTPGQTFKPQQQRVQPKTQVQQPQQQRVQPKTQMQQQQRFQPKPQPQQQQHVQPRTQPQQQQRFQPKPQPQQRQQQQQQKKKYTPGQPQSFKPSGSRTTGFQPQQRTQTRQSFQPRTQSRPQVQQQRSSQPKQQVRQQPRQQPRTQVRQQRPQTQQRTQQQYKKKPKEFQKAGNF